VTAAKLPLGTQRREFVLRDWAISLVWFVLWTSAGLLGIFGLVAIIPLGWLVLIAAGISGIGIWWGRAWPEALGLIVGVGALALIAGINNLGPPPACSEVPAGTTVSSCRGVPPIPFLIVGGVLALAGLVPYVALKLNEDEPYVGPGWRD
jgi:hypothetical protein